MLRRQISWLWNIFFILKYAHWEGKDKKNNNFSRIEMNYKWPTKWPRNILRMIEMFQNFSFHSYVLRYNHVREVKLKAERIYVLAIVWIRQLLAYNTFVCFPCMIMFKRKWETSYFCHFHICMRMPFFPVLRNWMIDEFDDMLSFLIFHFITLLIGTRRISLLCI